MWGGITRSASRALAWKYLGLANTNGQHHEHQLRIALAPQSTGHHHEISLETRGPGTHERPASPASAANCFGPAIKRSSSWDQLANTWAWHKRTVSITSISCELLWPRNQQVIITRSAWKHLGLAHTNGQHHQHQLRIAFDPVINRSSSRDQLGNTWAWHTRTASITSISCEFLNSFGPAINRSINRSSSRDQIGNTWAWHTRTASITSISCELLWPCNQQVIITRSAWKRLGLARTNGQHHQHQLPIALAPQSTGHHHEISLETRGPGTHERPASPAS